MILRTANSDHTRSPLLILKPSVSGFKMKEEADTNSAAFALARKRQKFVYCRRRSSYKERKGNALASGAEEGRDKLR